ncbi:MAG TPA: hypothetical protein VHI13_10625 [Candidatus Kapabacteria bacterium]|nr:hypothetical protein [Candidatus Kapabacteria bacterium]
MRRSFRTLVPLFALFVIPSFCARAQGGLFPFASAADSLAIRPLIERYLRFTESDAMPVDSIPAYAVDELADRLVKSHGIPIRFPERMHYRVASARATRADGAAAIAAVSVDADTLHGFGPLVVEWVFFANLVKEKGWRLSAIRRQNKIEDAVGDIEYLDSTSLFPRSLKPIVIRETGRILLSNDQLRTNFFDHREQFSRLAGLFKQGDSLWMLGRIDHVASQVNRYGIAWGESAQEIPAEARAEFLAGLSDQDRRQMEARFRATDVMRRKGRDTLAAIVKRSGLALSRVDSAVDLMRDLRISFVNSRLPWKDAVQFTVGGKQDDVLGYLYSPSGELPLVGADEYFYLEPLEGGWWIFRAT